MHPKGMAGGTPKDAKEMHADLPPIPPAGRPCYDSANCSFLCFLMRGAYPGRFLTKMLATSSE